MPETLFIFDCDGVLVDSEALASEVFSLAVLKLGLTMSAADAEQRFTGRSLPDCILEVERLLGAPVPEGFLADLRKATLDAFTGKLRAVDQVTSVLDLLRELRLSRCVASNGDRVKLRHALTITGLVGYFEEASGESLLFSADDVARGKPAPDLFLHAAHHMQRRPSQCIVIEDSHAGITAALAAGMQVWAYVPDERNAKVSQEPREGVAVFHSMGELKDWIRERAAPDGGLRLP